MASLVSGISKQHRIIRDNASAWCVVFIIGLVAVVLRLAWLQGIKHGFFLARAKSYQERHNVLPAARGNIRDIRGTLLAMDDRRLSLYADPSLVQNPAFVAEQLAPVIGVPAADILADLTRLVPFVWVKRDLDPATQQALRGVTLPGLRLQPDGSSYRVAIDPALIPHDAGNTERLAKALGLTREALVAMAGDLDRDPEDEKNPPPPGPRPLTGLFRQSRKDAVDAIGWQGIAFTAAGPNVSLGVDPRLYLVENPAVRPIDAAAELKPILGMDDEEIIARLCFKPRFVWLKRGMPEAMLQHVQRLQGTLFVVNPGRILAEPPAHLSGTEAMDEAVNQLDRLLNSKKETLVTRDAISAALQSSAAPGVLAVKLQNGKPSLTVARALYYNPIPGVMYGLPGINVQPERRRYYPFGTLAAASLGFVKYNGDTAKGVFGLERKLNDALTGVDGREDKEVDARQLAIPERSRRREPKDGHDVVLTLDLYLQQVAERALAKSVQERHAAGGTCIVLDPRTGEIRALATYPVWDANAPGKDGIKLENRAIHHVYEPGSTFKLVAVAGSLEEHKVKDGEIITYCTGGKVFGKAKPVTEHGHMAHGQVDPGGLLEKSCNVGAATLAIRLGSGVVDAKHFKPGDKLRVDTHGFMKWCRDFGFNQRTGIELDGEVRGRFNVEEIYKDATLARMGFGQSLNVTPLQMVAAYAAVANDGEWVQPHLVHGYVRDDGSVDPVTVPHHRVLTPDTTKLLNGYLRRVIYGEHGTAKGANVTKYLVAGKTGTAQYAPGGDTRGYTGYVGSFVGFVPADDPKLAIIAVIERPQGVHYGGVIAAPVFKEVATCAMQYLNVPPSATRPPDEVKAAAHAATTH